MEKDSKIDILTALSQYNLEHLVFEIFNHLSALDLKCCQLVSSTWNYFVESLLDRLNERWEKGQPSVSKFQCDKQRSSFSDHVLKRPQRVPFFSFFSKPLKSTSTYFLVLHLVSKAFIKTSNAKCQ